jgi:hypothetical protein
VRVKRFCYSTPEMVVVRSGAEEEVKREREAAMLLGVRVGI